MLSWLGRGSVKWKTALNLMPLTDVVSSFKVSRIAASLKFVLGLEKLQEEKPANEQS